MQLEHLIRGHAKSYDFRNVNLFLDQDCMNRKQVEHTFLDFQHLQKAAFSAMSSMSTKSATFASPNRIFVFTRHGCDVFLASGQNAKYETYPRPATAAVGGTKLIQSRTMNE